MTYQRANCYTSEARLSYSQLYQRTTLPNYKVFQFTYRQTQETGNRVSTAGNLMLKLMKRYYKLLKRSQQQALV